MPPQRTRAADVRMADVGDTVMRAVVDPGGRGAPVVVLEAGATLDASEWDAVIAGLRRRSDATIIAYDRAGMGASRAVTVPYDIRDEAQRLHRLLRRLGYDRGLVLVGHSYGGWLIQTYARLHRRDVKGMVYVDANTVDGIGGETGAAALIRSILEADAAGRIVFNDKRLSAAYVATTRAMVTMPPPCGMPVAVLTRGAESDRIDDAATRRWRDGHQSLAASTGGQLRYADGSGHMIPIDRPDLVVDAVIWTLARSGATHAARSGAGARCGPGGAEVPASRVGEPAHPAGKR